MHGSTDKEKQKRGGGRRRTEATERGLVHVHTRRIELSYKFFSTVVRRDDINQSLSRNSLLLVVDLKRIDREELKRREKRENQGKGARISVGRSLEKREMERKKNAKKKKKRKKKKKSILFTLYLNR